MLFRIFDDQPVAVRAKAGIAAGFLIIANLATWIWAWVAFADRPALLGTAFLAYLFGLRHAFDADHIAAIDNTVRQLMQQGKAPFAVGFFFSLGHSTIVVLASLAVAVTAVAAQGTLESIHDWGSVVGTLVSATFLLLVGIANLFVLRSIWAVFRAARHGGNIRQAELDAVLAGGGIVTRLFRPLFRSVTRSWHLYPIGFLFGLGFDTATEIGVLGIAAIQAAQGLSFWSILVFPALFTAGMSLMDTADSMVMVRAYGWAFVDPLRKLWYNLTITAASVIVALFIGGMEALGLIGDKLGLEGWFWASVEALNDNLANFGFVVVGVFVVSWIVSGLVYRMKGYDRLRVERP
ncbi:HoxN/HupN/NixA family nickel/cobalt transporter [Rhodopila sp.]|uniref:HoxN/HupN/NixA family nickel/cobalt transporter n=1 Tax=Rhodopila sp. TaxID=2480087 RepID=UPI002B844F20|nr:HoxN/HupN/NixA family nickel/cobalt transporter [Rhodopila sp.]HVZ10311.1 HoxN/HupN/NixA family nickel/cobalt transporter [Rhodopila sp.]